MIKLRKAIEELIRAHDNEFQIKGLTCDLWSAVDTFRHMLGEAQPEQEQGPSYYLVDGGLPQLSVFKNFDEAMDRKRRDEKWIGGVTLVELYTEPQPAKDSDKLKLSHARYEYVRALNAREFSDLYRLNLTSGEPFDQLVDKKILEAGS